MLPRFCNNRTSEVNILDKHRSGFVAIIGRPNVGKSTMMNAMIGEKIAIVTDRPQTTRNRIQGVMTEPGCQVIFIDTPGIHTPKNKLSRYMMKAAAGALEDIEGILICLDAESGIGHTDASIIKNIAERHRKTPVIAAVNKTDAITREKLAEELARLSAIDGADSIKEIFPVSALTGDGLDELKSAIMALMPEGPQYFPDDMITDQPERVIAAELIREKIILAMRDEIPYGIGVEIMGIESRKGGSLLDIHATIYCERASHKGMIIGKKGENLKNIGQAARMDIEKLFGAHVNLQLWVKVVEGWRNSSAALRDLGYEEQ